MAIVKPRWLASVEHAIEKACSTSRQCSTGSLEEPQLFNVWVACSGGLDSCVLLDIAARWSANHPTVKLAVIHINHQLSPNANHWQQHVEKLAASYGVNCQSQSVSVVDKSRKSLESQARDARYEAIFSTLESRDLLLLGQHLDDQVETVFLRLLRGSGPKGLGAIRPLTERQYGDKSISLLRPLLSVSRADLESYAREHELVWVFDESNNDLNFDRNMLRQHWLKSAQQQWPERWPGMKKAIARSAKLCSQQQSALELLLSEKIQTIQVSAKILSRQQLVAQEPILQKELLRYWIDSHADSVPSAKVLDQVFSALGSASDQSPVVRWGRHEVRIHTDLIYFLHSPFESQAINAKLTEHEQYSLQGALGQSLGVSWQSINNHLSLRLNDNLQELDQQQLLLPSHIEKVESIALTNNLGEYYFCETRHGKPRQLKKWFKDWKVPAWYRTDVAGVFFESILLAVIDGETFRINANPSTTHPK